jgi:hypothetical protein
LLGKEVTAEEIKRTIFSMKSNKAPGPDGYTADFFKAAWPVVGGDVVAAISSFFASGLLLKEVNATILTLVPKKPNPSVMGEFRPIACCNVMYKCKNKILSNRIYDSQSRLDAKLDSVLRNGLWCWKPARSEALVALQSKLPEIPLGITGKPIWTIAKKGTYINAETWNFLRKKKDNVDWWHLVWFPHAIPKQTFILWLTMHNRLSTGDRLLAWGYTGNTK